MALQPTAATLASGATADARSGAPAISFERVTIRFRAPSGAVHTVSDDISLDIAEGTFVAIIGPSGCGKSSLLHCAAGLLFPPEGRVRVCTSRALNGSSMSSTSGLLMRVCASATRLRMPPES